MLPKRVFSPSLKLLTSENRLKGNSQLDCELQTLPSNTGTIKKQTLPSTDRINISVVSSIHVENNKSTKCTNIDKNDSNNRIGNDVRHKKVIDVDVIEEIGSKSNKFENNLIGTQEIVAQHQGNYQSNSSSSSSSHSTNNDDDDNDANKLSKKIELSGKRRDVETKINNVPLRDVIQRKVSKLPHQLLHGSKELSTKLATAATTTTKNVSKTKRLLFRRKTTAITKDQIEAAKALHNINNSSSILLTLNNEPITVSLAQQQSKTKQKQQEKSQINQSHVGDYDTNNRQANVNAHQTENEQQQYYRQRFTSTKQKQVTNNVTIVTTSHAPSFDERKNTKYENKYKLNETNRNKNKSFGVQSNGIAIGNPGPNSNENRDIVWDENVSISSKRYYSKESLAVNKNLKSTNFALQIGGEPAAIEPLLNGKTLKIVQGKKPARPPSYVNPPSPTASNSNVKSNTFLACKQNNRTHSKCDEYENYAVPYVQTPTTPLNELQTNSAIHIQISDQFQSQSQEVNRAQNDSHLKNQNNSPQYLLQSRSSQNPDNKNTTNEIRLISNDCMLYDGFGQSTSSSDSSDSADALKLNKPNETIKMDPHTITNLTSPCDMLTKPEFSSSHLQNIPVRPRKGVPHLENYCLFDPSKDFVNEKEIKKKFGLVSGDCMPFPIKILDKRTNDDELIKETIYEDHDYVYDTLEDVKEEDDEDDSDGICDAFPNYFTIDPDYIEQNKMETLFCNANHLQPIVESETEDIYSDTNANLNKTLHLYENQQSNALKKKSPQMDKCVRQLSQPTITTNAAKKLLMSSSLNTKCTYTNKNESMPIVAKGQHVKCTQKNRTKLSPPTDLPLRSTNVSAVKVAVTKKRNSFTMKHSISTPQLSLKDLLADNGALPMIEIETKTTVSNVGAANRLSQCKIRRPASQHSDADSGFLSPVTPPSANDHPFNQSNSNYHPQCDTIQGYIELYTNWANHYLDKVKSKRRVNDLAVDCRDGLLLADVVEGVTSVKVPDLIRKPKTQQQMFENVNNCLNTLHTLAVGGLDGITTNDICAGRLRAILDLFYALSVYKQAAKQKTGGVSIGNKQQTQPATAPTQPISQSTSQHNQIGQQPIPVNASNEMLNRQLPAPYGKSGLNGTSIPVPATVLVTRRCPPDKIRPLPPTPGQTQIGAKTNGNCETTQQNGNPPTHIPKTNSGVRQQNACKILASPYSIQNHIAGNGSIVAPNGPPPPPTKHSMLDKLKLFNKEKSDRSSKTQISKRTSSSSGFSSARSERSDSSLSLNNDQTPNTKTTGIPIQSNLKKPEIQTKIKSKVMTSSTKSGNKDTLTKKSDKKDKSPARMSADMSDSKIAMPKSQKSSTKIESKLKPVALAKQQKSMDPNRSDGKMNSSAQMPPSKTNSPITNTQTINAQNAVSTGIPKPMAAIKGTTKPPSNIHNQTNGQKSTDPFNENNIKNDKLLSDISNQNNNISTVNQDNIGKMQIIAPILIENAVNQQMLANHLHMQQALLNQQNISMNDSCHSKSTHSSSTGTASNSSESGLIYRPASDASVSDTNSMRTNNAPLSPTNKMILINQRHKHDRFGAPDSMHGSMIKAPSNGSIASTASSSVTGVSGISNLNANKFNTVPSKPIQNANGIIYEEEKQMTIMPMRPLLRGYSSHLTLPTRGNRNQQIVHEYSDDIGQGYCSDGDALRKIPVRYSDIENGYVSEGGGCGGGSSTNGNTLQHKPMLLRARTQLPTTIEERCRSSRGEHMDSVGLQTHVMDLNSGNRHRSPLPPPANGAHLSNGNGNIEQWPKLADQSNGRESSMSPTPHRKDKGSPSHSRRNSSSKNPQNRAKSAPQNFSYIKRPNGTMDPNQQIYGTNGGRTAHVSAVPRSNKIKVSGGTQTCTADLQSKLPANVQHRSFSLTGPSAAQLSQSIRERLANGTHSLPKPGTDLSVFQHRMANRGSLKMIDGSLSDTQTYAEVKTDYSSYAMWLKHSNTTNSRLSEGDTVDITGMGTPATTRTHKMMQRESSYTQSPRLNRSNSIRSTKSEKMYPSMFTRGQDIDVEPYYCLPVGTLQNPMAAHQNAGLVGKAAVPWSQPTSPTPPSRFSNGPLSPTQASYRLTYPKKNDDTHGSTASLISGGSSLYGSAEERQANEVRRLKRELGDARDQVNSLSTQLTLHASLRGAFEQSLSDMTSRLHQLSATAERKDGELMEMRQTIELLRKQSIQAGLTSAHIQSMSNKEQTQRLSATNSIDIAPLNATQNPSAIATTTNGSANALIERHLSSDSMCSLNSIGSACSTQDKNKKKTGWLRTSFKKAFSRNPKNRYATTLEQIPSNYSIHLNSHTNPNSNGTQIVNDMSSVASLPPPSPTKQSPHRMMPVVENAKPIDAIDEENPIVEDLKKQLREKDLVLTDIRLEALSSASQLESLKDTVSKMRHEMMNLKHNNERLQKLVTTRSLAGSEISLGNNVPVSPSNGSLGEQRRYSLADSVRAPLDLPQNLDETEEEEDIPPPAPEPMSLQKHNINLSPTHSHLNGTQSDHLSTPAEEIQEDQIDGKKISIVVYLEQPESFGKYAEEIQQSENEFFSSQNKGDTYENGFETKTKSFSMCSTQNEFVIAFTYISGKTTWQNLDYIVRKTFKDYLARIDPGTNLGLNTDSITSYHLGEAKRGPEIGYPELLPCGYIVGNVRSLYICLQGVGSLAFDSLIPRSIVHRYISLLTEHRRLILCGPSGTGKSYLARKLAEFLVTRSQRENPIEAIATFNVDHKSSEELQHYLGHIAAQASMSNGASELPSVIILDNLHHASALGDVFQVLLSAGPASKLPCIIGTMSQATCNTTNLQLHHNFRWVLTANHMEPVKGFLARFLRRRLYTLELSTNTSKPHLASIFAWLPNVWQHINRFLETHSSSDVTIGPRLFLSCPLDLNDAQVWFTDVWNYHLAPYLQEAVREGVQLYGRRGGAWIDPVTFVRESYPWSQINGSKTIPPLRQINAEDVGLEGGNANGSDSQDPLLNMLMRLQEAANYSNNPEQESDCASIDSNVTVDSSSDKLEASLS